jgi:hypothetical protein
VSLGRESRAHRAIADVVLAREGVHAPPADRGFTGMHDAAAVEVLRHAPIDVEVEIVAPAAVLARILIFEPVRGQARLAVQ